MTDRQVILYSVDPPGVKRMLRPPFAFTKRAVTLEQVSSR